MPDDQIRVDIVADYDDKGAKAAKKDLDAIDGREAEAEVSVDDNASKVTGQVDSDLNAIDGRSAEATIDIDDNASTVTGDVDSDLDKIDGRTADATVDVDVGPGLADASSDLETIDGGTFKATVDASQGAGLASVVGDLKAIDGGTYKATVDADEGAGLAGVKSTLSAMGTTVGGVVSNVGALTGPTGLLAAVAGGFLAAATEASNVAVEAEQIASFTSTSTEEASRLAAVLRDNTQIEAQDLLDIIAQMAGVLEQNPSLIAQFGMTMDQVRQNPLAAFVSIVDQLGEDGKLSFQEMIVASQLFGEEGVRQVNEIITKVGPGGLRGAMDEIADTRVISEEDVQRALEMKRAWTDMTTQLQGMALTIGTEAIPILTDMLGVVEDVGGAVNEIGELGLGGGEVSRSVWDWINQFPSEKFVDVVDTLEAAGVSAGDLRENLFDLGDVKALLDVGVPPEVIDSANLSGDAQKYLSEQIEAVGAAARDQAPQLDNAADTADDAEQAFADLTEQLQEEAQAHRDAAEAAQEQVDALLSANDVYYANQDAIVAARDAVDHYNEVVADGESTQADQREALRDVAQAADDLAESEVDLARQQKEADGATLSATDALDIQNRSLLTQASTLDGPTRLALLGHIGRLNDIPDDVISQILALIDQGKIDEAEQLLTDTSRTRTATVEADAEQASVEKTERELEHLARNREANVTVNARRGAGWSGVGGAIAIPDMAPVPAMAGGDTYNLNLPRGTRVDDTVRALDRHARRNGRRPYAFR